MRKVKSLTPAGGHSMLITCAHAYHREHLSFVCADAATFTYPTHNVSRLCAELIEFLYANYTLSRFSRHQNLKLRVISGGGLLNTVSGARTQLQSEFFFNIVSCELFLCFLPSILSPTKHCHQVAQFTSRRG